MSTWKLQAFIIYLYKNNISGINGPILSKCDYTYAGDDLLLLDTAATLPLAMPSILPSIYTRSLALPALICLSQYARTASRSCGFGILLWRRLVILK